MYYLALLIQVINIYDDDYSNNCNCTNCLNYDLNYIYNNEILI